MTNPAEKNHEIKTLLRLIAPDAVEVELVSLSSIEKAEFLFFWSTIFLTVWGTILGTWLSLVTVDYANRPVLNLLFAVLIFVTALVVVFTYSGFKARNFARRSARSTVKQPVKLPLPERMDKIIANFISLLPNEFTEVEFKSLVNKFDDNNNDVALQAVLFDRLIASGAAKVIEGSNDPVKYAALKK